MILMKRATVLFSGGIDSTSTALLLKSNGLAVRGLFVDFGQASRHMERKSIARLRNLIGIEVDEIQISELASESNPTKLRRDGLFAGIRMGYPKFRLQGISRQEVFR